MVVIVVMVMMVLMFIMVVIIVVMVVAAAGAFLTVLMVVVMVMMVVLMLIMVIIEIVVVMVLMLHMLQLLVQSVVVHGLTDLLAAELGPGRGDQAGVVVQALQQLHSGGGFGLARRVGAAEDDQVGVFHLVVEKLAEVAHIHAALAGIHHGDLGADVRALHLFHGLGHVGQLAHAGRLDDDAVGGKVLHHLFQGLGKVAHQGAADAAGVHLGDLHAGILQKAAVNGDLAELVFDQNQLFAFIALSDELADQGRLARAEKS